MTLVIHQVKSISRHVDNTVFRIYLLCEIDMCQGLTWTTLFQPIDVHICATVGLKTTMATCGWVLWNFGEKEHEWLLLFLALLSTGFESAGCDLLSHLVHWSDWWKSARDHNANRQMFCMITCQVFSERACSFPNCIYSQLSRWFLGTNHMPRQVTVLVQRLKCACSQTNNRRIIWPLVFRSAAFSRSVSYSSSC